MKKSIFFVATMIFATSANAQNFENGKEFVDLGLSVNWATCNLGATSPEDAGNYFAPQEDVDPAKEWGGTWRMPTKDELNELIACEWEKGADGGYIVKGNGNSIFLPAAGFSLEGEVGGIGDYGYYLSSTFDGSVVYYIFFEETDKKLSSVESFYLGEISIRPVCEKPDASKLNFVEKDNANTVYKTIENGQIVIVKNGVKYNLAGQKL